MLIELLVILVFVSISLVASSELNCSPCRCVITGHSRRANCSNLDLRYLPDTIPSNIKEIDASSNSLESVNIARFKNTLRRLNLARNNISVLNSGLFQHVTFLEELNLGSNRLHSIEATVFSGLRYLRKLDGLTVDNLEPELFTGLRNLKSLSLKTDDKEISRSLFSNLTLESVKIVADHVEKLPNELFECCPNSLKTVSILGKSLRTLPEDIFKKLSQVISITVRADNISLPHSLFQSQPQQPRSFLNLSQISTLFNHAFPKHVVKALCYQAVSGKKTLNKLQEITLDGVGSLPAGLFNNLPRLRKLDLHRIRGLSEHTFVGLTELQQFRLINSSIHDWDKFVWMLRCNDLRILDLSFNGLEVITSSMFTSLPGLRQINLSHNKISRIDGGVFETCRKISWIDLSHNNISTIEENLFTGMWTLKYLNLSNNAIRQLGNGMFRDTSFLLHLDCSHNQIEHVGDVLGDLQDLATLKLQFNNIKQFPGDLESVNDLRILDLSHNKILNIPVNSLQNHYLLDFVSLAGNNIQCDCGLVYLLYYTRYAKTNRMQLDGTCDSPPHLRGRMFSSLDISHDICGRQNIPESLRTRIEGAQRQTIFAPETTKSVSTNVAVLFKTVTTIKSTPDVAYVTTSGSWNGNEPSTLLNKGKLMPAQGVSSNVTVFFEKVTTIKPTLAVADVTTTGLWKDNKPSTPNERELMLTQSHASSSHKETKQMPITLLTGIKSFQNSTATAIVKPREGESSEMLLPDANIRETSEGELQVNYSLSIAGGVLSNGTVFFDKDTTIEPTLAVANVTTTGFWKENKPSTPSEGELMSTQSHASPSLKKTKQMPITLLTGLNSFQNSTTKSIVDPRDRESSEKLLQDANIRKTSEEELQVNYSLSIAGGVSSNGTVLFEKDTTIKPTLSTADVATTEFVKDAELSSLHEKELIPTQRQTTPLNAKPPKSKLFTFLTGEASFQKSSRKTTLSSPLEKNDEKQSPDDKIRKTIDGELEANSWLSIAVGGCIGLVFIVCLVVLSIKCHKKFWAKHSYYTQE